MKYLVSICIACSLLNFGQIHGQVKTIPKIETYTIIKKTTSVPGIPDNPTIKKLDEALSAFYAAMGGSNCYKDYCDLTTALGFGKQGSEEHKSIIKKYFPNDTVAALVIKQNCYLRPSGASYFSDFEYLTITNKGDTVIVDYKLMQYSHGKTKWTEGPDMWKFKDSKFEKINRNLWTWIDQ